MTKLTWWLAWVAILGLGIWLRFWQLGWVPVGTYWDETAILLDATSLVQTGKDIHGLSGLQSIFPSYGDYKLPVYIWLATASVKVFGVSQWAVRFPSAIIGVLTILLAAGLMHELTKELKTSKFLSLITGLIVAISPWSLQFSRTGFEGHVGQFFLGASIFCWLRGKNQPALRWVSGLIGAIGVYCYYSVRFVWPVVLIAILIAEIFESYQIVSGDKSGKINLKQIFSQIFSWGVGPLIIFGLSLIPLFQSNFTAEADKFRLSTSSVLNQQDWAIESNELRDLAGNHAWDRVFYHRHWLMARELALNYADNLSWDFMFISGDPNLRHGTGKIGLFYWWALPGLIAGAYWWAKKKLPVFLVLLIWWLVALLPASVPETTPHALRSLNALLPLALIIAAGCSHILVTVWEFVSQLNSKIKPVAKWLFWLVLTISLLWPLITYLVDYYGDYKFRSVSAWQGGYSQLAEKILELNNINALTWIQTDDTRFYLWVMLVANQKDIQLNPKKQTQFVFSQLGPYQFSQVDWFKIARNQEPILVVMTTSDFNREIKLRQLKPSWVVINQTFPTQTSYSIAGFHWPEKAALP